MLVIASVNVANLMLVRTKAREVELAMRSALGASPGRVIRQILAESMVLAACGGALGLALAAWGVSALVQLAPEGLPRLEEIVVNGRIALFAVAVTAAVAFGFGLWPAWRASRAPSDDRPAGKRAKHVGPWKRRSQLAACVERARHRPGTARRRRVAAGQLRAPHLAESRIRSARSRRRRCEPAGLEIPRCRSTNPISRRRTRASIGDAWHTQRRHGDAGPDAANDHARRVDRRAAGAASRRSQHHCLLDGERAIFRDDGHRLLRGRALTRDDSLRSPDVVVINEAFARRYFPGQDPIGKRIAYGARSDDHYWRTIVGLAADTREQLGQPPKATTYAPFRQGLDPFTFAAYLVKTSLPVATVGETVQRAVSASDPDQPISRLRPVEADMRASVATQRFTMLIATLFAGLALMLAAIGTFGVMSHVVRNRTREIGVRMALGATRRNIVALAMGEAGAVVLASTIVGLAVAAALGRYIQTLLYEVTPGDPSTMALSGAALMGVALLASYVPIRRMLAQNPLASLRND